MQMADATGVARILLMMVNAMLCNNFVLSRFLGICPFIGVSKRIETAFGMGMAVTFVMALASLFCYLVQTYILVTLGNVFFGDPTALNYLQTIAYILVIAALVQFVEMFLKKSSPTLYSALGIYLPLITTNCAVLGVTLLNLQYNYGLIDSVLNGVFGALGFTLAIVLMAGINERLELANIPETFRGFPISLIQAGLMSIAFLGFSGLIK